VKHALSTLVEGIFVWNNTFIYIKKCMDIIIFIIIIMVAFSRVDKSTRKQDNLNLLPSIIYIYIYIYVYICMHIYIYVYIGWINRHVRKIFSASYPLKRLDLVYVGKYICMYIFISTYYLR
jgi:predicted MFS family arabinose efflux permease